MMQLKQKSIFITILNLHYDNPKLSVADIAKIVNCHEIIVEIILGNYCFPTPPVEWGGSIYKI